MTFKTVETIASSAIATSGTVTFAYPAGTSAGTFAAYGHKMWVDKFQRLLESPVDFTLAFTTVITATYKGSTSIPAGARLNLQVNIEGTDDGEGADRLTEADVKRTVLAPVVKIDLGAPITADANGYIESQNLTTAGVFSVNTTVAAALAAAALDGVADVPRNVVASWTGTAVLTITGTDEYGNVMKESSGSGTTFTGKKAFKTVTNVETSANITSLTVGTGDVLGLPSFLSDEAYVVLAKEGSTFYDKASKMCLNLDTPTLADAGQVYGVSPVSGHIKSVTAVTNTVVATADATLTVKTAAGTVGTIVIATSGSAVGDIDTLASPANTLVAAGASVEVENDAAPSAGAASLTVVIEPGGLFVPGVSSAATATTGDTRGTYDPIAAMDGSTAVSLFVIEPDPKYLGVAQYAG